MKDLERRVARLEKMLADKQGSSSKRPNTVARLFKAVESGLDSSEVFLFQYCEDKRKSTKICSCDKVYGEIIAAALNKYYQQEEA